MDPTTPSSASATVGDVLVANHRELLRYVERRIGDRALAEEILQDAFVRATAHADEITDSALGWLYRVLRNAVVDHQRRQAAINRRLDAFAAELQASSDQAPEEQEELQRVACQCVLELARTLKPEYAEALQRVDVEGAAVKDFAVQSGISASNAGVRLFRARDALRKQLARACGTCSVHGCLDCTCNTSPSAASSE
jgi:RNA polymerase sigma factor (sigma-70 family)